MPSKESINNEINRRLSYLNSKLDKNKNWNEQPLEVIQEINTLEGLRQTNNQQEWNNYINQYNQLHAKNIENGYINQQEQDEYSLPEVNIEELRQSMNNIKDRQDLRDFSRRIGELGKFQTSEIKNQLNQLHEEAYLNAAQLPERSAEKVKTEKSGEQKQETPLVEQSKFQKIYEGARGRIKNVFSKIKSFVKGREENQVTTEEKTNKDNDAPEL